MRYLDSAAVQAFSMLNSVLSSCFLLSYIANEKLNQSGSWVVINLSDGLCVFIMMIMSAKHSFTYVCVYVLIAFAQLSPIGRDTCLYSIYCTGTCMVVNEQLSLCYLCVLGPSRRAILTIADALC